jgi:RNA polymerase sigma-70 factor (ECF subfamily)
MRSLRDDRFERLYAEHAQALFAFLSYRTGDRGLAEDLLADTFERAFRARGRFDRRKASEKTWLYAIALNCLRDHTRRRASEGRALERLVSGGPDGASAAIGGGREARSGRELDVLFARDIVASSLGVLSDEEREAIALRFGAELTVPEIAKLTGARLTTVEGRVYRALRKLRDRIEESAGAQPKQAIA